MLGPRGLTTLWASTACYMDRLFNTRNLKPDRSQLKIIVTFSVVIFKQVPQVKYIETYRVADHKSTTNLIK
jgi:hypothetical protein